MGNVSGAEFYEKAVIQQDEKAVKEILAADPSLASWVDDDGYSVLQRLCAKGNKLKILQLLVKNGAPVDYQEPKHMYTALMLAAKSSNVDFVSYLLKVNANPVLKSKRGKSAAELTKVAELKAILQKAESIFDEGAKADALSNGDSEGASVLSRERALQPEGKNRRPFQGKGSAMQQSGKSESAGELKRMDSGLSGSGNSRKYDRKPATGRFTGLSSPSGQMMNKNLSLYTEDGDLGYSDDENTGGGVQQSGREKSSLQESEESGSIDHLQRWLVCWYACSCQDEGKNRKCCARFACNPYSCCDEATLFNNPEDFSATAISGDEMRQYIFSMEFKDYSDGNDGDGVVVDAVNNMGEAVPPKSAETHREIIERLEMLEEQVVELDRSMQGKFNNGQYTDVGRISEIKVSNCGVNMVTMLRSTTAKCVIS